MSKIRQFSATTKNIRQSLLNDLAKLKSSSGYLYAGFPRFQHFFGRDTGITSWQLLKIDPRIAKATLIAMAKYQGRKVDPENEEEPGKIPHEHYEQFSQELVNEELKELEPSLREQVRSDILRYKFPYYGGIDSTFWFLFVLSEYFRMTQDKEFVKGFLPNIERAVHWIIEYGDVDRDELIEYERKNPSYGIVHQGWKDANYGGLREDIKTPIAIVEAQGYYYLAYQRTAELLEIIKKDENGSTRLKRKAVSLKKRFNEQFWMQDEDFFAFMLDGNKQQVRDVTYNVGHLLFTGIIEEQKIAAVVKRFFQDDLWTPYGIRTLSSQSPYFDPKSYQRGSVWIHDNWIIREGLLALEYFDEAERIKRGLFSAYQELGKPYELFLVENGKIIVDKDRACPLQAWAVGSLLEMVWSDT